MKDHWIFLAYKSKKEYPLKPFHKKIFESFKKMKLHSARHSYRYKHARNKPDYISTYIKTTSL